MYANFAKYPLLLTKIERWSRKPSDNIFPNQCMVSRGGIHHLDFDMVCPCLKEVQGQQEECSVKNVLDIVLIRCARHTKYLRESHNDITLDYNMKRSKILACCIFDSKFSGRLSRSLYNISRTVAIKKVLSRLAHMPNLDCSYPSASNTTSAPGRTLEKAEHFTADRHRRRMEEYDSKHHAPCSSSCGLKDHIFHFCFLLTNDRIVNYNSSKGLLRWICCIRCGRKQGSVLKEVQCLPC